MKILAALTAALLATAPGAASAYSILFDDFEDSDLAGWTLGAHTTGAELTTTFETVSAPAMGDFALKLGFTKAAGSLTYTNPFTRASRSFTVLEETAHALTLDAGSRDCQGCTMYYEIYVDGVRLARDVDETPFTPRSFDLDGLSVGVHTLTLGFFTNVASSGDFFAVFDNVEIANALDAPPSTVPLPGAAGLLAAGAAALAGLGAARRRG